MQNLFQAIIFPLYFSLGSQADSNLDKQNNPKINISPFVGYSKPHIVTPYCITGVNIHCFRMLSVLILKTHIKQI